MMTIILESALRTAITTAFVWATLRLFRVRHVVAQKVAWCLVLSAAVAMPSLMRWHAFNFPLPVALRSYPAVAPRLDLIERGTASSVPAYARATSRQRTAKLYLSAATAYLIICAIFLLRLLIGLTQAFHVWRRARPVSGLSRTLMRVRTSRDVNTPFTIGFGVVLPSSFDNWDPVKLQMVLAHERSHILQADFFLQLLARLYVAFFWFSPASWWLQNELGELGEAISDHAAITQALDRCSYAEVLLEFATVSSRRLAGLAMARPKGMSRRIDRILNDALFRSAFTDGKTHIGVAIAAFSLAVLVSTSHVVHAANKVSPLNPPTAQGDLKAPAPSIYQIGGAVTAPQLVWAPDPVFPTGQKEGGVVVVSCVIDVEGRPKHLQVVRHLGEAFDKNAMGAVKQYRFKPTMLLGKPVPVELNIQVNFAQY
jgi:TonB family protein